MDRKTDFAEKWLKSDTNMKIEFRFGCPVTIRCHYGWTEFQTILQFYDKTCLIFHPMLANFLRMSLVQGPFMALSASIVEGSGYGQFGRTQTHQISLKLGNCNSNISVSFVWFNESKVIERVSVKSFEIHINNFNLTRVFDIFSRTWTVLSIIKTGLHFRKFPNKDLTI